MYIFLFIIIIIIIITAYSNHLCLTHTPKYIYWYMKHLLLVSWFYFCKSSQLPLLFWTLWLSFPLVSVHTTFVTTVTDNIDWWWCKFDMWFSSFLLFFFLFSLSFNWNSKYLKCYEQPKTFPLGFRQKEFLMACPFGNVQVGRGLFALYDDPPPFFLLSFWCEPLGFTRGPSCRRHLLVERWGDSSGVCSPRKRGSRHSCKIVLSCCQ